jgi:hypothetical protein
MTKRYVNLPKSHVRAKMAVALGQEPELDSPDDIVDAKVLVELIKRRHQGGVELATYLDGSANVIPLPHDGDVCVA